jgi:tetratricopeptide (TPR) repeat protein
MLKKYQPINAVILAFVFLSIPYFANAAGQEDVAKRYFQKKEYSKALPIYQGLVKEDASDPMLLYYYGVCLTETGHYTQETKKMLLRASLNRVPNDVYYFIGKNYHAQNDFHTALSYYNRFNEIASKSEKRNIEIKEAIKQCKEEVNPFIKTKNEKPAEPSVETIFSFLDSTKNIADSSKIIEKQDTIVEYDNWAFSLDTVSTKTNNVAESSNIVPASAINSLPKELVASPRIEFRLTNLIYYNFITQFRSAVAQKYFVDAWQYDQKLKSMKIETDSLRDRYDKSGNVAEMKLISDDLIRLENQSIDLRLERDQNRVSARQFEMDFWNNAPAREKKRLAAENDSLLKIWEALQNPVVKKETPTEPLQKLDSVGKATVAEVTGEPVTKQEPVTKIVREEKTVAPLQVPVLPAAIDSKVVYKVQIGRYAKNEHEQAMAHFRPVSSNRTIDQYTQEDGMVYYTVGETTKLGEAVRLQNQIRTEGINDAFVVAFYNGKRITLNEAKAIK